MTCNNCDGDCSVMCDHEFEVIDKGLSFYLQSQSLDITTSDTSVTQAISVPSGRTLLVTKITIADISGATSVQFNLTGFGKYYSEDTLVTNDLLPMSIKTLPLIESQGGVNIKIIQPAVAVTATIVVTIEGILCSQPDLGMAKKIAYRYRP